MGGEHKSWSIAPKFWWLAVILLAGIVYFSGIAHESIWWDESFSAFMAGHSPVDILRLIHTDNHPPLYYLLLSGVVSIFGNSEWALRLLSVLGAVGLVGLGAGPIRRLFGDKTAFMYAVIVLTTPVVLIYAHEARMYSLANLSVTACVLYAYLAVKTNHAWDWFGFGLASLAAAYLHYYGLMATVFTHVFVLAWLLMKLRDRLKPYLITAGAVLIGYLPWLPLFFEQVSNVHRGFWIRSVSWEGILNGLLQPFAYKEIFPPVQPTMAIAFVLSMALIVAGLVMGRNHRQEDAWKFGLLALLVYVCSFVAPILISLVSRPIFYERYIIVLDGVFLLLVCLGINWLPNRWLRAGALGIFVVLNVFTLKDVYTQHFNYPMRKVAEVLKGEVLPGDLIITSEQYSMGPALYYFPQAVHYYSNNSIEAQWDQVLEPLSPHLHGDAERDQLLSTHQVFWYINCNSGITKNIATILKGQKGWEASGKPLTFSEPYSKFSFTAVKYVHTGREPALKQGTIKLRISGLKPAGNLLIVVYNKAPFDDKFYRSYTENISAEQMDVSLDGVDFGEYAIVVYHDENKNDWPDSDPLTGLPSEGIGIVNAEKMDFSNALTAIWSFNFPNLKFSFTEPERTFPVHMLYPPFSTTE